MHAEGQDEPVTDATPYDESYYRNYYTPEGSISYERSEHWLGFFGQVADQIVARLRPATVLDVGCAIGLLVESLHVRGVDARGFDVSEWAVSQAPPEIRERLWAQSATDEIAGRYDLVLSVETVEHLEPADAHVAIARMAAVTDQILLSTTPEDFAEPTHLNVRPVEYWAELLAAHDFFRDPEFDASFLSPWAALYRRERDRTPGAIVRRYERERWRLHLERDALRRELQKVWNRSQGSGGSDVRSLERQVEDLRHALRVAVDAAEAAEAAHGVTAGQLRHHQYALDVAKERQREMVDIVAKIDEDARQRTQDYTDLKASTTFKIFWALMTPYRKLRRRL